MNRVSLWLIALAVGTCVACAPSAPPPPKTFGPAEIARGKVFYDTNGCAACHGADGHGDGQLAPTLTPLPRDFRRADAFKGPRTVAAVAAAIAQGIPAVPTPMPAFVHLDEETRQLMAAYVLSLAAAPAPTASLVAEDAWARQPAPSRDVTAVYVTLTNPSPDAVRIVAGESPVAKTVELHEMSMDGEMMRMRRVGEVVVPGKGRVALEPGGLHVMLFGVTQPLVAGARFPLTLKLGNDTTVVLDVTVRGPEAVH